MEPITFRSDMVCQNTDHMGGDDAVIQAMLVSSDDALLIEEMLEEKTTYGRINFLMRKRHGTPFEHAALKFYVEAPIFVFREWHRHRIGWSYNEASARYRELPGVFYVIPDERPIVKEGKPGDQRTVAGSPELVLAVQESEKRAYEFCWNEYQLQLRAGVAPEVARNVLNVAIYTYMFATCNPRSLMAFLSLRTHDPEALFPSGPLWEIEVAARLAEEALETLFPLTYRAFVDNRRVAP